MKNKTINKYAHGYSSNNIFAQTPYWKKKLVYITLSILFFFKLIK